MKLFLAIAALVLAAIVAPLFFKPAGDPAAPADGSGLPWQIEVLADGSSRVFGLTPGKSTLADARSRFGSDMELAIVTAPGEAGSLELYYARAAAGFVTGALVLTAQASPEAIDALRRRAVKTEYMDSSTRRTRLHPDDIELALQAPLAAISFIPSVNLDTATVLQRFGQPAERRRGGEHSEHLLYPAKGLDVVVDSQGKELLQYVAPHDFERLRAPLLAAPSGPGASQ